MEPNQNVNSMTNRSDDGVVFRDKPKRNVGMIVGMVILAVLAAGGVGFGVWAFLSGNQKEADLNNKIDELNAQITEMSAADEQNEGAMLEIGDCVFDPGTAESGAVLKCAAVTDEGSGVLTYDSISNVLQFVLDDVDMEDDVDVETESSDIIDETTDNVDVVEEEIVE